MTKEWEKPEDLRRRKPVLWLTMTALFMAMVVVLSMSAEHPRAGWTPLL